MLAIVLASAFLEKFGGDSMSEIHYTYSGHLRRIGCRGGAVGSPGEPSWWDSWEPGRVPWGKRSPDVSARSSSTWTTGSRPVREKEYRKSSPRKGSRRSGKGSATPSGRPHRARAGGRRPG